MNNCEKPLGLPEGSVRAVIALAIVFVFLGLIIAIVIYAIRSDYVFDLNNLLENTIQMTFIILAFYFGMRNKGGVIEKLPKERIVEVIEETVNDECLEEE